MARRPRLRNCKGGRTKEMKNGALEKGKSTKDGVIVSSDFEIDTSLDFIVIADDLEAWLDEIEGGAVALELGRLLLLLFLRHGLYRKHQDQATNYISIIILKFETGQERRAGAGSRGRKKRSSRAKVVSDSYSLRRQQERLKSDTMKYIPRMNSRYDGASD